MNKFEVVSKYKDAGINLPRRSTAHAAGYDFEVAEDIVIMPLQYYLDDMQAHHSGAFTLNEMAQYTKHFGAKPTLVPTGIKAQINTGWYLKLTVRSSLPLKHWLILANSEGIIDGDYYNNPDNEGEIFFQLINLSPFPILLKKGDKIGQGIFVPYDLVEGDNYGEGEERKGGFGSTSKKLYNDFINVHGKKFSFKDNIESSTSGYIVIGDAETTTPIEPKYITPTNVAVDSPYTYPIINGNPDPYQLTFDDIRNDLL